MAAESESAQSTVNREASPMLLTPVGYHADQAVAAGYDSVWASTRVKPARIR